ncbi:MAG: iron chelate uptake ABC transporter family permease subunit, partial [Bryobacteraceae bacterium]
MAPSRVLLTTLISAGVALLCLLTLPMVGSSEVSYAPGLTGQSPDYEILFQVRLPRVLLALLSGSALALSGVLFQSLLRDALATPYTLGVSSGASLGAVIAISYGWRTIFGVNAIWVASFIGALATLLAVLGVASKQRRMSPFTLLLAGVTINSICMAAILFLHSIAPFGQSLAITRWLMGGIEAIEMSTLAWLAATLIPAFLVALLHAR